MLVSWQVEKSFGNDHYVYKGEDSILRYIASYERGGTINFYICCAHYPNPAETNKLIEKVQKIFKESIGEIQSSESLEEQLKQADFSTSLSISYYPERFLGEPKFEVKEDSCRDSWINGKFTQLSFETYTKRYVAIFINILDVVFNLGDTTDKLFTSYKINPSCANLSSLISLVDCDRFEEALKKAGESAIYPRYVNIQFEFGQNLEEKNRYDLAYEVYNSIKQDHPLFEKAKERMFFLIQNTKNAVEQKSISKTSQEMNELLLVEIDNMFNLPKDQQPLIDQRIHELCGKSDLTPILTEVRYDPQTILAFCNHIKSLNEKIASLESKMLN